MLKVMLKVLVGCLLLPHQLGLRYSPLAERTVARGGGQAGTTAGGADPPTNQNFPESLPLRWGKPQQLEEMSS